MAYYLIFLSVMVAVGICQNTYNLKEDDMCSGQYEEIYSRLEQINSKMNQFDSSIGIKLQGIVIKIDQVDSKMDQAESKIDHLKSNMSQINTQMALVGNKMEEINNKIDTKFQLLDTNMDLFDSKIDQVNTTVDQIAGKVNQIDEKLQQMDSKIDSKLQELMNKMDSIISAVNPPDKEYLVVTERETFNGARAACRLYGGDLVSLNNMKEYYLVLEKIQQSWMCTAEWGYWTSLNEVESSVWVWGDTDERVLSSLWANNEPNGDGNCGHIETREKLKLNDRSCGAKMCYICEKVLE